MVVPPHLAAQVLHVGAVVKVTTKRYGWKWEAIVSDGRHFCCAVSVSRRRAVERAWAQFMRRVRSGRYP